MFLCLSQITSHENGVRGSDFEHGAMAVECRRLEIHSLRHTITIRCSCLETASNVISDHTLFDVDYLDSKTALENLSFFCQVAQLLQDCPSNITMVQSR